MAGFKWDKVLYASDYFDDIYAAAVKLIKRVRHMLTICHRKK